MTLPDWLPETSTNDDELSIVEIAVPDGLTEEEITEFLRTVFATVLPGEEE